MSTVLDESVLSTLENLLGWERVAGLSRLFEARVRQSLHLFSMGGAGADEQLEAHNLVSIAGQFGLVELVELGRRLHRVLRDEPLAAPMVMAEVSTAVDRALILLRRRYPQT